MKFIDCLGRDRVTRSVVIEFTRHAAHEVNFEGQIRSNTRTVEIYDYVSEEGLNFLISQVENKTAFKGALRRVGLLED